MSSDDRVPPRFVKTMRRPQPIQIFVCLVVLLATSTTVLAYPSRSEFAGLWGVGVLLGANILLEMLATRTRGGDAEGTLSFMVHLAAGVLFGAFWGAVLTAGATTISQVARRRPTIKVAFNVGQRTLSTVLAITTYQQLGGAIPPAALLPGQAVDATGLLFTLVAFAGGSLVYFITNGVLVSIAVGLSTGKGLLRVWRTDHLWVLGYDLAASSVALAIAWLYLRFDSGPGRVLFLLFLAPIVGAKHLYQKLNRIQLLYDELDKAHDRLELALREQLETMVRSIEARDPYTSGHSRRVAALSRVIARDLGLSSRAVEEIENAALLHDVGKIHAEFAPLLQKEGRLTQDEWEIMKTHAAKSAELVGLFSRFKGTVQAAVRSHHERWDGKGYPDGLSKNDIPLGARIIMVSDTIDAMTTDRPYRKALAFERVIAELQRYRGSQFDPTLVDITIGSVTVRRLVSDKEFLAEHTRTLKLPQVHRPRPAFRSQSSMMDAIRAGAD